MSNSNNVDLAKKILDAIKIMIKENVRNLFYNRKKKAKILSLNIDGTVDVKIGDDTFNNVKVRAGLLPEINEVVWVEIPNNNMKEMYVDTAKKIVGDDTETKHTHNNLSLLQTITQSLVDTWNTVTNKVDKIEGKGLSTEDYTTIEKNKLAGISANANKTEGSNINGNIKIDGIETTVYTHPSTHPASIIVEDSTHRFVTDAEKDTWNNKQDSLGYTPENIANKGVVNGYASLDSNGKIPLSQIPDATFNTYTYYQITPSDNWVIKHNLNRYPSVTIVDSSGNVVVGEVKYIDNNTINISLVGVFAGTAYLN
jgi:hypothetical protein